jgi:hypothetical protein
MQYDVANVYGYNSGLGMKTSAYPAGTTGPVHTAGIGTLRSDILYGSFRIRATVPSVSPSACLPLSTDRSEIHNES